jgi:hypothetical protein
MLIERYENADPYLGFVIKIICVISFSVHILDIFQLIILACYNNFRIEEFGFMAFQCVILLASTNYLSIHIPST